MKIRPAIFAELLKRLFRINRIVANTIYGNFWVDPVSNFGWTINTQGLYEQSMINTIQKSLFPGAIFVDIGSNEGYFTVIASKLVGPSGRVISIEPQERLLPVLKKNLELNGIEGVRVLNLAITDRSGEGVMHLSPNLNSGSSALDRGLTKYPSRRQAVKTRRLGDILNDEGIEYVDLMKVDIEGFEYEAILGSPEIFEEHRVRTLALELHPSRLAARSKSVLHITDMLASHGYRYTGDEGNSVWIAP
jgi:FkbM family methyltransferase